MSAIEVQSDLARKAGFEAAADKFDLIADRQRRLVQAYEFYRYVSKAKIEAFQARLKDSTIKIDGYTTTFDQLVFEPVEKYAGMPPKDVLEAVSVAKERGIFDVLEVASIQTQRVVADPIVFGRITGCPDRFFVAQWGDDVKLTDLIGEHDG